MKVILAILGCLCGLFAVCGALVLIDAMEQLAAAWRPDQANEVGCLILGVVMFVTMAVVFLWRVLAMEREERNPFNEEKKDP
jgi:hypothetical protein